MTKHLCRSQHTLSTKTESKHVHYASVLVIWNWVCKCSTTRAAYIRATCRRNVGVLCALRACLCLPNSFHLPRGIHCARASFHRRSRSRSRTWMPNVFAPFAKNMRLAATTSKYVPAYNTFERHRIRKANSEFTTKPDKVIWREKKTHLAYHIRALCSEMAVAEWWYTRAVPVESSFSCRRSRSYLLD